MQVQVDIEFDDLVKIVKKLPPSKLRMLVLQLERKKQAKKPKPDLETLLLKGPVATKRQVSQIKKNRKAINQWRTKQS